jgi:glycerol-3-phosphate dehydrogenase (NAD(P)+)
VMQLARQYKVDMPISEQVYRVLYEHLAPADAVMNLLARNVRPESAG